MENTNNPNNTSKSFQNQLDKAEMLFDQGDYQSAILEYNNILTLIPTMQNPIAGEVVQKLTLDNTLKPFLILTRLST